MFFAQRNNNVKMVRKSALLSLHRQSNSLFIHIFSLNMICFDIFEVLGMYVLKSGLMRTSTSSHSLINFQQCMYQLRPRSSPLCVLQLELPQSQVPLSIFYCGKNIVDLACHVSFSDSFQFCRIGLKKQLFLWK